MCGSSVAIRRSALHTDLVPNLTPEAYLHEMRALLRDPDSGVVTGRAVRKQLKDEIAQVGALASRLAFAHPFRLGLEAEGETRAAGAFVKHFERRAKGLAVASDRAVRKQLFDESLPMLDAQRIREVLETFLADYVELHAPHRLGCATSAFEKSPVLYLTASEFEECIGNAPDVDAGIIKTLALTNPLDLAAAIERHRADVTRLGAQHPDLGAWLVRRIALRNPSNPDVAMDTFIQTVARLSEKYPDLEVSYIQQVAVLSSRNPDAALAHLHDTIGRLRAEHPDLAPWIITRTALHNPSQADAALTDVRATMGQLAQRYPDVDTSVITYFAVHAKHEPDAAVERFRATMVELEAHRADLRSGALRAIALSNPTSPDAAVARLRATVARLSEEHPDLEPWIVTAAALNRPKDPDAAIVEWRAERAVPTTADVANGAFTGAIAPERAPAVSDALSQ